MHTGDGKPDLRRNPRRQSRKPAHAILARISRSGDRLRLYIPPGRWKPLSRTRTRRFAGTSGGEAQRIKLSKELSKRDTGQTLYILDEPTTGLHFQDIEQLLGVLHRLRDHGNTVVVIEHNLDVIKTADWVIDLGPEGGDKGGEIIAQGTPEQVAKMSASYTGQFLARILSQQQQRKSA